MSSNPTNERASSKLQLRNQGKHQRYIISDDMDLTDNLKGGLAAISGSAATTRLVIEKVPTNIDNGTPIAETVFKDGRVPITDPPIIKKR